jgi:hypothetical protein
MTGTIVRGEQKSSNIPKRYPEDVIEEQIIKWPFEEQIIKWPTEGHKPKRRTDNNYKQYIILKTN